VDRQALLTRSADAYARVAIANIRREYPVHLPYLVTGPGPLPSPRQRHPVFYGSYDWHSCVLMHWVLARLLRVTPGIPSKADARRTLDAQLTTDAVAGETRYFEAHRGFERPYGWGWLLFLARELATSGDADAQRWSATLRPLAQLLERRFVEWLPKATYPLRMGLHGNTAFAMSLALSYARSVSAAALETAIVDAATRWFADDRDYPAAWEPSGSDFLSPALTEALLMRSVLGDAFAPWLDGFLPGLAHGEPRSLFRPAIVADASDGQTAHLHGLNLSRAWCMREIAEALPERDPRVQVLRTSIDVHADASLGAVVGSDYMVEHWLAAYALLLLS
jgi:hypothetical protein